MMNLSTMSAPKACKLTVGMKTFLGYGPKNITIVAITADQIRYTEDGKEQRGERWIIEDLIAAGCRVRIESLQGYLAFAAERPANQRLQEGAREAQAEIKALRDMLA